MSPKTLILIGVVIFTAATLWQLRSWKKQGVFSPYDPMQPHRKSHAKDRDLTHYPYATLLMIDGMDSRSQMHLVEQQLNALSGVYAQIDYKTKECIAYTRLPMEEPPLRAAVSRAGCLVLCCRNVKRDID